MTQADLEEIGVKDWPVAWIRPTRKNAAKRLLVRNRVRYSLEELEATAPLLHDGRATSSPRPSFARQEARNARSRKRTSSCAGASASQCYTGIPIETRGLIAAGR